MLVMEYTDLELNKMIAELEGFKVCKVDTNNEVLFIESKGFCYTDNEEFESAEPYYVDLLNLMFKYKVEISHTPEGINRNIFGWVGMQGLNEVYFKSESEIERAIKICILKSENII